MTSEQGLSYFKNKKLIGILFKTFNVVRGRKRNTNNHSMKIEIYAKLKFA